MQSTYTRAVRMQCPCCWQIGTASCGTIVWLRDGMALALCCCSPVWVVLLCKTKLNLSALFLILSMSQFSISAPGERTRQRMWPLILLYDPGQVISCRHRFLHMWREDCKRARRPHGVMVCQHCCDSVPLSITEVMGPTILFSLSSLIIELDSKSKVVFTRSLEENKKSPVTLPHSIITVFILDINSPWPHAYVVKKHTGTLTSRLCSPPASSGNVLAI